MTVSWSESVCRVVGSWPRTGPATTSPEPGKRSQRGDSTVVCDAEATTVRLTSTLTLANPMPNGAFVEATLNIRGVATTASDNEDIRDIAGNFASAPQSRQATATAPETTAPTIVSAQGAVGSTTVTVTFSEPVYCTGLTFGGEDITLDDSNAATADPTVTGTGSNACGSGVTTADTSFSVTLGAALPADRTYTLTLTPEANQLQDIVGNELANPSSIAFTTGAGDFTPPTMVDARMVNNLLTTDFTEVGDSFSLTFSEAMNGTVTGTIQTQDQDGTILNMTCGTSVTCTWNTAVTTITVTISPRPHGTAGTTPGIIPIQCHDAE